MRALQAEKKGEKDMLHIGYVRTLAIIGAADIGLLIGTSARYGDFGWMIIGVLLISALFYFYGAAEERWDATKKSRARAEKPPHGST